MENSKAVATTNDSGIDTFLMEHAGAGGAVFFKFAKGKFQTRNDEEIAVGTEFTCAYDAMQVGWIKFNGKGNAPTRAMGPLFNGFLPPLRNSMGDLDETKWDKGPDGAPLDPWQMQMPVPLVSADGAPYIFATTSVTGRSAVGKLIATCRKMKWKEPDQYPVVRLATGGFQHRIPSIGFVTTPAFVVVGKTPKDGTAVPSTSIEDDMEDSVPF
jgi:hypothetical protein